MTTQCKLARAYFLASCAVSFGAGYLVLSQIRYGVLVAMAVTLSGAVAKILIYSSGKLGCQTAHTTHDLRHR